jgi:hypothetical protein
MINTYGNDFKWFFGIVEDRNDPKKLGRVRVRVYNVNSLSKTESPTDMLPWAFIINSPTSAGINEVGISPTGLMVGTTVFGFFADGENCQLPMILGTLASIPDDKDDNHEVSQLARGKNNIEKGLAGPEPDSAYAAKYPYNKTFTTEGGHAVEFDDTPGAERIHIFHKSGTYVEIDNEGTRVDKTVGDKYSIMIGSEYVYLKGTMRIVVEGDADISVAGDAQVDVDGETRAYLMGGTNIVAAKDVKLTNPDGDITVSSQGDLTLTAGGALTLESQGNMTLRSTVRIDLNPLV